MKWLKYIGLIVLLILIDRLVKYIVVNNYDYVLNEGIALSLFNDSTMVSMTLHLLGIVLATWYLVTNIKTIEQNKLLAIAITMIIAGGIGNIIDRIIYGGVVDFISIWIIPTFNIADTLVTVGVLFSAYIIFLKDKNENNSNRGK